MVVNSTSRKPEGERKMYDAVCTKCKSACQVPFPPTEGREVLCKKCWDEKRASMPRRY